MKIISEMCKSEEGEWGIHDKDRCEFRLMIKVSESDSKHYFLNKIFESCINVVDRFLICEMKKKCHVFYKRGNLVFAQWTIPHLAAYRPI